MHAHTDKTPRTSQGITANSSAAARLSVIHTAEHGELLEYRRRLALAVVKPHGNAILIDANNNHIDWVSIDVAIARRAAFAVEVANDIFAVDSDRPENAAAVHQLVGDLRNAGHRPILVASGQPGRLHLFARIPNDDERRRVATRARELDLDVRHCIRPPLAPHRLGRQPQLLDPVDPKAALAALERVDHHGRLSGHMQRLLEHGDTTGRYASRSEVVQAIAQAAVNAGWQFERLRWALLDPRHGGGQKVQEIAAREGKQEARQYIRKSWTKAWARARTSPAIIDRTTARTVIVEIEARANLAPWSGRAGSTDRAVLQSHIEIAMMIGHLDHGASVRQVAERSGVSALTAHKSQQRLARAGWLRCLKKGRGPIATTWRLCSEKVHNFNSHYLMGGREMSVKVLHTSADAFRWGALGKSPWRVWNALLIDVGTALMTLADRLPGMSRDTVRRSLRRLETHGLARCDEDGLWRRLERDLDEVARELGKGGVGARQREQHAEQRLAYQEAMATRRYREQARGRRPGSDDDRSRRPEGKS